VGYSTVTYYKLSIELLVKEFLKTFGKVTGKKVDCVMRCVRQALLKDEVLARQSETAVNFVTLVGMVWWDI